MMLAEVMRIPQKFIKHDWENWVSTGVNARALCPTVNGVDYF